MKPATKEVWKQVVANLREHFGEFRELASVTAGDAEDFKLFLIGKKLAPTTVHKRLQFDRMFFRAAKKYGHVESNPFQEVSAKAAVRQDRFYFVTREETEKLLAVCDVNWKAIIALNRYGGLQYPSEVLSLRWEDVNWATNRITAHSPKTEHHPGKAYRVIPIFAALRPVLFDTPRPI